MNMPKYDIKVQVILEAEDMEFDSEAEAEAYGWTMVDKVHDYYVNIHDIQVDEQWEPEEEE